MSYNCYRGHIDISIKAESEDRALMIMHEAGVLLNNEQHGTHVLTDEKIVARPSGVAFLRPAPDDRKLCPDGGTCHHSCGEMCWRVKTCCPLSDVFPDDEWPQEVIDANTEDYEGEQVDCAWHDYPNPDTRIGEQG